MLDRRLSFRLRLRLTFHSFLQKIGHLVHFSPDSFEIRKSHSELFCRIFVRNVVSLEDIRHAMLSDEFIRIFLFFLSAFCPSSLCRDRSDSLALLGRHGSSTRSATDESALTAERDGGGVLCRFLVQHSGNSVARFWQFRRVVGLLCLGFHRPN